MSISFNHPKNIVTSTGSLNLVVSGGSTTAPQPIRFSSTSVIMPVRPLPTGEAGAMVFDSSSKSMKYHDGLSWIEILSKDAVLEPIYTRLTLIENKLNTKIDSVSYISGSVPQATISGTQLNIVFPLGGGSGGGANGLFTSSKRGAIQQYALQSGMNAAAIREQMSGSSGGQAGRNGTQANPWITNDGWCFADGMYWTWLGDSGTVTQLVPNLNNAAYLKPMAVSGVTQIGSMINASGSVSSTALTVAQLPPLTFTVSGSTSSSGSHVHNQLYNPMGWSGTSNVKDGTGRDNTGSGVHVTQPAGEHIHTFTGTTNTLGSGQGHTHTLSSVDVAHYNVAVIYNIATPSFALNEASANSKYVLKSGDIMTGSLTIATAANVRGADTNLTFAFRNASNGERAMIYHSSANNTLRLRSAGGSEVTISNTGAMVVPGTATISGNTTVGGKNVVRSVNGVDADASGAVTISAGIQDIRLGVQVQVTTRNTAMLPVGYVAVGTKSNYNDSNWELDTMYGCPIEKQVNGQWYVVNKL